MHQMLGKSEKQKLRKHFCEERQHPLFLVCDAVFCSRGARLEGVKADGEDVFREVATLLDKLMAAPEHTINQDDVDGFYTRLVNDVREWQHSTPADRIVIADTVFRIVRKLMCHQWDLWHSEWIYNMMGSTLNRESRKADGAEIQEFESRLMMYSEQLNDWINLDYDGSLYKEIEEVTTGKVVPLKKRSGRKQIDPNNITASFSYLPDVSHRINRLQVFFDCLNGVFISGDKKVFTDMFMDKPTNAKILWIRDIKELAYLFNKLSEQWITWPKNYSKWQMVCAHFQIRVKSKVKVDDSMTNDSYTVEDLSLTQFSKGGKLPKEHDELDRILKVLNPDKAIEDGLNDYLSLFDEQEHSELEDYRDALANDLKVVSRL